MSCSTFSFCQVQGWAPNGDVGGFNGKRHVRFGFGPSPPVRRPGLEVRVDGAFANNFRVAPDAELRAGRFAWEFALAVEAGAGEGQGLHPWCKDALVDVWWYRVPLFLRLPG